MTKDEGQRTKDFKVFLIMILLLVALTGATLFSIVIPRQLVTDSNASPYGFTWSLLIFIGPIFILGGWFFKQKNYAIEKKAFYLTTAYFFILAWLVQISLASTLFTFKNQTAVLGIYLPSYNFEQGWLFNTPLEDLAFYFLGTLFMLLLYIWADLFWYKAYHQANYQTQAKKLPKIISRHWPSAIIGGLIIVGAIIYKKYGPHPYQSGFPGYLTLLVGGYASLNFIFFNTAKKFINWRALSFTMQTTWFISLFWEATLAYPYQWWGYNPKQITGIVIAAWGQLPLEPTILWLISSWGTTIVYEVTKIALAINKPWREALFGFKA